MQILQSLVSVSCEETFSMLIKVELISPSEITHAYRKKYKEEINGLNDYWRSFHMMLISSYRCKSLTQIHYVSIEATLLPAAPWATQQDG